MAEYRKKFVAVDLETTHLDMREGKIMEVGAAEFEIYWGDEGNKGNRVQVKFGKTFSSLVNPEIEPSEMALAITGIKKEELKTAAKWGEVKDHVQEFIGNRAIVGHNIGFDMGYLGNQGLKLKNNLLDTLEVARTLLPLEDSHSLESLAEGFAVLKDVPHRALVDCQNTARVAAAILNAFLSYPKKLQAEVKGILGKSKVDFLDLVADLPEISTFAKATADRHNPTQLPLSLRGEENAGEGARSELTSNYELVDSKEKYHALLKELKGAGEIAIDTETTSIHPVQAELLGLGIGWEEGKTFYILRSFIGPELIGILEDSNVKKTGHNIKYDYLVLKQAGIKLAGIYFDTMIAAYLLNPGARNFDLDSLSFNEFGITKIKIESLIGKGKEEINMREVEPPRVAEYCGEDVDCTWRLKQKLKKELKNKNLEKIFYEIEMPLVPVLAEMENSGIKIDIKYLKQLSERAETEADKIQKKIWKLAGEEFNIGSPLQLKKILFDKLEIPSDELKKGKTGLSTAAAELEKLRGLHPIVDLIFDWRELTKLKNTYLDALPGLIYKKTGRLHTSFNQTIAATGRLSSSDPNLQNIPIRTTLGREVRKAFVAEKSYKLVSIDYSQIELRLAAHISGDPKMTAVFKSGGDIHTVTAQEIFGVKNPEEVTADMRRSAKTINFGVLYGLSAYGLKSRIPGVSVSSADDFIKKYFETYKRLAEYLDEVVAETKKTGYVRNELGRLRFLPEINSSQFQVRSAAERAAINMPFQSLSADIIKMAMNKLAQENLISREDCRLLLQVHDELVFEIAENKIEEYTREIMKIMQGIYKLKVPLVVDAKAGDNWEEMERLPIQG